MELAEWAASCRILPTAASGAVTVSPSGWCFCPVDGRAVAQVGRSGPVGRAALSSVTEGSAAPEGTGAVR